MSMIRFWNSFTKSILEAIKPKLLVEIGADYFLHTQKLLEYCRSNHARLVIIDPEPKAKLESLTVEYSELFEFIKGASIDVIPLLETPDILFIDGDHNYYTVYHELKIVDENAKAHNKAFPTILLHDVSWPYARRDLYYDTSRIPQDYLLPNAKMGIAFGRSKLVDKGGINGHLHNAVMEGGVSNGVLTAIEDFLAINTRNLIFIRIPAHNGIGILLDRGIVEGNDWLTRFVDAFHNTMPWLSDFIENLETINNQLRQDYRDRISLHDAPQKQSSDWRYNLHARTIQQVSEKCVAFSIDSAATRYYKSAPISISYADNKPDFASHLKSGVVEIPARKILFLKHSTIIDYGTIIMENRDIIHETLSLPKSPSFIKEGEGYRCVIHEDRNVISEPVILASKRGVHNYGHFLVEIMPRLAFLKGNPLFYDRKILLHEEAVLNWQEIFNSVGLDTEQVIHHKQPVNCRDLVYPTLWTRHPFAIHPACIDYWKRWQSERKKTATKGRRFYIGRRDAGTRLLVNEQEVLKLLEGLGFESLNCGTMGFLEQVDAFAEAECIVSVAGAALTNMIFSPSKIPIICMAPETMPALFFWDLAVHNRQYFHMIYGRCVGINRSIFADFQIKLPELKTILKQYLN